MPGSYCQNEREGLFLKSGSGKTSTAHQAAAVKDNGQVDHGILRGISSNFGRGGGVLTAKISGGGKKAVKAYSLRRLVVGTKCQKKEQKSMESG